MLQQQDALVATAMFVLLILRLMEDAMHDHSTAVAASGFSERKRKIQKRLLHYLQEFFSPLATTELKATFKTLM